MTTNKRILSPLGTLGTRGNGPTRRNLFGPVDRDQLQVEYQASLRRDLEEACQRWGFDFTSDTPLESSDFQWEGVPGSKVPLLYRSCLLGLGHAGGQRSVEAAVKPSGGGGGGGGGGRLGLRQSGKENIPCSPQRCPLDLENLENLEKTPGRRERTGLKRKQTNITDFYQAKRRVVGMPRKSGE